MANEITLAQGMGDKLAYAKQLAGSELLPKTFRGNPGNLLWAIEFAESLGVPPMVAITSVHVIEGKPSASANLISALVRRAGHKLRVKSDDRSATAEIIRSDDPDYTFSATWTFDRATKAGLTGKQVWKSYPAAMLKARAITECARMACEEALNGIHYTPEELGVEVDGTGTPTKAAAVVVQSAEVAQDWPEADRKRFMATLGNMGVEYDDLKAFCTSIGRPLPRDRTAEGREELLRSLQSATGRKRFDAWLAEQTPQTPQDATFEPETPATTSEPANAPQTGNSGPYCKSCGTVTPDLMDGVCFDCSQPASNQPGLGV